MVKNIYLDLCEAKKYWNVEYFCHETNGKTYLKAKRNKKEKESLFIPCDVSQPTNLRKIRDLLVLNKNNDYESVFMAMISPDSTCIYYEISDGLVEPQEISINHLKKNKHEELDSKLRKNHLILEQAALYGIPVTLPKIEKCKPGTSQNVSNKQIDDI